MPSNTNDQKILARILNKIRIRIMITNTQNILDNTEEFKKLVKRVIFDIKKDIEESESLEFDSPKKIEYFLPSFIFYICKEHRDSIGLPMEFVCGAVLLAFVLLAYEGKLGSDIDINAVPWIMNSLWLGIALMASGGIPMIVKYFDGIPGIVELNLDYETRLYSIATSCLYLSGAALYAVIWGIKNISYVGWKKSFGNTSNQEMITQLNELLKDVNNLDANNFKKVFNQGLEIINIMPKDGQNTHLFSSKPNKSFIKLILDVLEKKVDINTNLSDDEKASYKATIKSATENISQLGQGGNVTLGPIGSTVKKCF